MKITICTCEGRALLLAYVYVFFIFAKNIKQLIQFLHIRLASFVKNVVPRLAQRVSVLIAEFPYQLLNFSDHAGYADRMNIALRPLLK